MDLAKDPGRGNCEFSPTIQSGSRLELIISATCINTEIMKLIVAVLVSSVMAHLIHAQSLPSATNATPTKIEMLEATTNAIIVKGLGDAGSVSVGSGVMVFQLKESFNADTGARLHGLSLDYAQSNYHRRELIDYDELNLLIKAIDYILSVNHNVTRLPNFMVQFRTRTGFQVIGIGNQRQSFTEMYLQFSSGERMPVNPTQMAQLRGMLANCAVALEALGARK